MDGERGRHRGRERVVLPVGSAEGFLGLMSRCVDLGIN